MKRGDQFPYITDDFIWFNNRFTYQNREVLVLFWSISCEQCHEVLLKFDRDQTVNCSKIAVHMPRFDEDTDINAMRYFLERNNIRTSVVLDHEVKLSNLYNVEYVPTIFLFDRQLRMKLKKFGGRAYESIRKYVN